MLVHIINVSRLVIPLCFCFSGVFFWWGGCFFVCAVFLALRNYYLFCDFSYSLTAVDISVTIISIPPLRVNDQLVFFCFLLLIFMYPHESVSEI